MAKRLEIVMNTKDKSGKTRYTKVGSAFVRDDGSISLSIDPGISISTPDGTWCNLQEPLPPRGESRPASAPDFDSGDTPF